MRENDYSLDLLASIEAGQLKVVGFSTFNVADELEVIKVDIMVEIRRANHVCPAKGLISYFNDSFPHNFTLGRF